MESFDHALKYLLEHEPAAFIRFALRGAVEVIRAVPTALPSRGRDVDGGCRVRVAGGERVAHTEFHRRNQSRQELAVDVAEAQIRFFRREKVPAVSMVWDLYGDRDAPVWSTCTLAYAEGSVSSYTRVNLRGMGWEALLAEGPAALWSLVALTGDGATPEAVKAARDAIDAREELTDGQRADQLAVLWFVAEAEAVAVKALRMYIREEELMQSVLYQEIFGKGEARGEVKGRVAEARVAIADVCELCGVALTPERDAWVQAAELHQLHELRAHLKRERAWPETLPG
jgi:predicted transposase YdaD